MILGDIPGGLVSFGLLTCLAWLAFVLTRRERC